MLTEEEKKAIRAQRYREMMSGMNLDGMIIGNIEGGSDLAFWLPLLDEEDAGLFAPREPIHPPAQEQDAQPDEQEK